MSAVCALAVTGTGLTGCGDEDPNAGTNGVGKLSAEKIQAKTTQAARSADAVHLSGSVVSNGRTYKLDMRLKADGGTGSVTTQDTTFRLLRVGEHLFLKADADFWADEDDEDDKGGEGGEGRTATRTRRPPKNSAACT